MPLPKKIIISLGGAIFSLSVFNIAHHILYRSEVGDLEQCAAGLIGFVLAFVFLAKTADINENS